MFQLKTNVSCVKTQEVVKNLFLFDRGSNYLENTWSTDKSWWKIEHLLLQWHTQWQLMRISLLTMTRKMMMMTMIESRLWSVSTQFSLIRSQWKINKNMSGLACKATMIFEIIFLFAGKMKVSQNKSKKSIEICVHVMQRCLIIGNQWKYLDSSHH